jgi:hypothetical protein
MRLIAALLVLAALGSAGAAAGTPTGGLRGLVTRGPTTPVCRAEERCDAPAANTKLVFLRKGVQVASVRTSASGAYRVAIAPGRYAVGVVLKTGIGRRLQPSSVRVLPGRFLRVNFSIDTGIR